MITIHDFVIPKYLNLKCIKACVKLSNLFTKDKKFLLNKNDKNIGR